jgi:cytochrome P450
MNACRVDAGLPDGPRLSASKVSFQWLARPFAFLDECAATYGDTFTLQFERFGTHVVLAHPEDIRSVFTGDPAVLHAGRGNALLEPILGRHSLLLVDGDRHVQQRTILQPAFRNDRIRSFAGIVAAATRRWTDAWRDGGVVNIQRTTLAISKDVILRVVLGLEGGELERFSQLIHDVMLLVGTNATFDQPAASPLMDRFRAARHALDDALQAQVERRRHLGSGVDMLSTLLAARTQAGQGLSDEEIRDQLITMILAGHETTASSITWALVCLHAQPDALHRLRHELDAASGLDLPYEAMVGLSYLQAVCLETLRLRPVIPVVSRQLQGPFRLRDTTIPAGMFVTPCAYLAHRRPEVFPEPDSFRPQRFLEQRFSPYTYFPFGGGARRCIGMSFALLELQIVLGTLLRTFRFEPVGPVRPVRRAVTIVASGGGRMRVERRAGH